MECIQCHEPIRPGARFCNHCGISQDAIDILPTAGPVPQYADKETIVGPAVSGAQPRPAAASAPRMPRPPRVVRTPAAIPPQPPAQPDAVPAGMGPEGASAMADAETLHQEALPGRGGVR